MPHYYCDVCQGACQGAAIMSSRYHCNLCEGPCQGAAYHPVSNNTCMKCEEDCTDTAKIVLACSHVFHYSCLNRKRTKCPTCKQKIE